MKLTKPETRPRRSGSSGPSRVLPVMLALLGSLVVSLLCACSPRNTSPSKIVFPPAVVLPAQFPGSSSRDQAALAVKGFSSPQIKPRVAAVVGVLAAVGVPTVGSDGMPVPGTGADPIGIPWPHIVGLGAGRPNGWISLSALLEGLNRATGSRVALAPAKPDEFLAAIRGAMTSRNERVRFFAEVLAEANRKAGGPDLSAAGTTAKDFRLDAPAVTIFIGRYIRSYLLQSLPSAQRTSQGNSDYEFTFVDAPAATKPPVDCTSSETNGWGIWLASKALGGVGIALGSEPETIEFAGLFRTVFNIQSDIVISRGAKESLERIARAGDFVSAGLTILTTIQQMALIEVQPSYDNQLARNKKVSEGDGGKLRLRLVVALQQSGDADNAINEMNCFVALLSTLGNNSIVNVSGPVAQVEVEIVGHRGFSRNLVTAGTLVLFSNMDELKQHTNNKGEVFVNILGRHQDRDVPDKAAPIEKSFSVGVSYTLEPFDGALIGRSFLDSFLCALKPGPGCADVASDLVKVLSLYKNHEVTVPITDWSLGWTVVEQDSNTSSLSGASCDGIFGPWHIVDTLKGANRNDWTYFVKFDASGQGRFTMHYKQRFGAEEIEAHATGDAKLTQAGDEFDLRFEEHDVPTRCLSCKPQHTWVGRSAGKSYRLVPATTQCPK